MIAAVSGGWAAVANAGLLLALLAVLLLVWSLLVLRRHQRTIEAAERLEEGTGLTDLMIRHLAPALRTNVASQEIPLLKMAVEDTIRRRRRTIIGAAALAVLMAPAAGLLTHERIKQLKAEQAAPRDRPQLDVLKFAAGTWGRKYDARLSCDENPITVEFYDNNRKMSVRFRKRVWNGSTEVGASDYEVIGTRRNELVLSLVGSEGMTDQTGKLLEWSLAFTNPDTYSLKRSDQLAETGEFVRCGK